VNQAQLASGDGRLVLMHDITQAHALKTQAARNERLAAMGELAAGLAHQLRTPLAAALLYVGNLTHAAAMPDEDRQRIAVRAVERLKALERLIRDTLLFARGESLAANASRWARCWRRWRPPSRPWRGCAACASATCRPGPAPPWWAIARRWRGPSPTC